MKDLIRKVDNHEDRLGKLEVLEGGGSSGVTSVTGTAPIASSGGTTPAISIAITPANPGGAVALQGTTPGTAQTGNANLTGTILAATMTASGTVQGATVTSTGAVNAATAFNRNGIAMNNVTVLDQVCRVLDDTTSRATGYTNSAVQVTGVTDILAASVTLPATLKAVWFSMFLITAAGANVRMAVENPDFVAGASTLQGSTVLVGATIAYSGGGVVSLSSLGRLRYVYGGSANVTRTIIDIWGYVV
jgi:hypothetical protein